MPLRTSKPTGQMPYPTTVIAGVKGSGKTSQLVLASASDLVGRSFLLTVGEERPDAFAGMGGADFEMIEHDGTFADILDQIREVHATPRGEDGRPNFFGLDTMSAIWNLLLEQGQTAANRRAQLAAQRQRSAAPVGPVKMVNEDWEALRRDWGTLLNLLRTMDGPVAMTARLEELTVTVDGVATAEKVWRMRADPNLGYEVTAVIEMARRGEFTLTKLNDPAAGFSGPRPWPDFTLDAFWRDMGLGGHRDFGVRVVETPQVDPSLTADSTGRDWIAELAGATTTGKARLLLAQAKGARASAEVIADIEAQISALTATTTQH